MGFEIGLALCTYNRLDYLKQVVESLERNNWGEAEVRMIIDDCSTEPGYKEFLDYAENELDVYVFRNTHNSGIAHSKNTALSYLMESGCTHLFLMEDDILMKNTKVCEYYVKYAKMNNLKHLNFALHGTMNMGGGWTNDSGIKCYPNCVGAFSYYHIDVIHDVGFMDENFKNAWEHIEHTYRIIKADKGYHPPFWEFADCILNDRLLEEIPGSIDNSAIRPRADWADNIKEGQEYWLMKHGEWLPPRPKFQQYADLE